MSKLIKKALALFMASCLVYVPAAADPALSVPEDQQLLLAVPGSEIMLYYAFDDQGNNLGRLPVTGWGDYAKLVSKNRLFPAEARGTSLIRASDLQVAVEYPEEEYTLLCMGSYYVTVEKATGTVTLYNESTEAVGTITPELPFSPDKDLYGDLFVFPDTLLLNLNDYHNNLWLRFDTGSSAVQEIKDPLMLQYLNHEELGLYSIGSFLVACPYKYSDDENLQGVVMTLDGLVIMDGIEVVMQEEFLGDDTIDLHFGYLDVRTKADAVVRNNGGTYDVYDASLEKIGSFSEKPDSYMAYGGGYVKGLPYPELNGNPCEGFVFDVDTQSLVPYARNQQVYQILKDGRLTEVPAEGKPERISSAYCVVSKDEGTNVYRTKDASLFASFDRFWQACLSLGSEGIRLTDDVSGDDWWDSPATIYDNEGNPTYHSQNNRLYAFINGTWTCQRGVYRGLIDMEGNWVLRDIFNWQM